MKDITIDCRGCIPRSALHETFANALSFPDHYGRNLDALHDCLTALSQPTHLQLTHWQAGQTALGPYARALHRVLEDSARENPRFSFTILE